MEFDKSKVFTTFNCDEVKIGCKGYFSDSRNNLIDYVISENKAHFYHTLKRIKDDCDYPFVTDEDNDKRYFYLVEEPKEKTKRPCKREELLEMLKKQGIPMVVCKDNGFTYSIVRLNEEGITVISVTGSHLTYDYKELCNTFTLLDGTELWVEE